ncbi:MAG: DsbA family protein [Bacteroidota bacterium]
MRIVIIGGGIAGLVFGIMMRRRGHQVIVNERFDGIPVHGNAFMVHGEGLALLRSLGDTIELPGQTIDSFLMKRPNEEEVRFIKMDPWQCVKRSDLIRYLVPVLGEENIRYGRDFSHFIYDGGKAVSAVFEDGSVESGDLFVGADGRQSKVRETILGETHFSPVEIHEILGLVRDPEAIAQAPTLFQKYQHGEKGLSFGYIPYTNEELIWYIQYDVNLLPCHLSTKEDLKEASLELMQEFPDGVRAMIEKTDFDQAYLWKTRDFNPLPRFHSDNVVLMGDAAHVALPFTSAGTTNAIYDAQTLVGCLERYSDLSDAFVCYYKQRIGPVSEHVRWGRQLKASFLDPTIITDDQLETPLIGNLTGKASSVKSKAKVEILYFTDPICSTCWTIQPELRKLKLTYGDRLSFRYVMAGLLPGWKIFYRGGIRRPSDVAAHWDEVSRESGMPIDGSLWIDSPLRSSFPPSIAFKAAQLQNIDKAIIFLRKINEMVFIHKVDITRTDVLKRLAYESGLDAARLMRDITGKAVQLFYQDLQLTKELKVHVLPTFIFLKNGKVVERMMGGMDMRSFESVVMQLDPTLYKIKAEVSPVDLFKEYPSLTKKEFRFLTSTSEDQADQMLAGLMQCGSIKECRTDIGSIWMAETA